MLFFLCFVFNVFLCLYVVCWSFICIAFGYCHIWLPLVFAWCIIVRNTRKTNCIGENCASAGDNQTKERTNNRENSRIESLCVCACVRDECTPAVHLKSFIRLQLIYNAQFRCRHFVIYRNILLFIVDAGSECRCDDAKDAKDACIISRTHLLQRKCKIFRRRGGICRENRMYDDFRFSRSIRTAINKCFFCSWSKWNWMYFESATHASATSNKIYFHVYDRLLGTHFAETDGSTLERRNQLTKKKKLKN